MRMMLGLIVRRMVLGGDSTCFDCNNGKTLFAESISCNEIHLEDKIIVMEECRTSYEFCSFNLWLPPSEEVCMGYFIEIKVL